MRTNISKIPKMIIINLILTFLFPWQTFSKPNESQVFFILNLAIKRSLSTFPSVHWVVIACPNLPQRATTSKDLQCYSQKHIYMHETCMFFYIDTMNVQKWRYFVSNDDVSYFWAKNVSWRLRSSLLGFIILHDFYQMLVRH